MYQESYFFLVLTIQQHILHVSRSEISIYSLEKKSIKI